MTPEELKNQKAAEESAKNQAKAQQETAKAAKSADEFISNMSVSSEELAQAFRSISDYLSKSAKSATDFGVEMKQAERLNNSLASNAEDLVKFTKDNLKDAKLTNKVAGRQAKVEGSIQALKSKQAVLQDKLVNATEEETEEINKILETIGASLASAEGLVAEFDKLVEKNKELNDDTAWLDGIDSVVKDIPIVGKLFGEFGKAAKKAREDGVEGGDSLRAGAEAMASAASKMVLAFAGGILMKGLKGGDERITNLSRNLNVSRERARELNAEFNRLGKETKSLTGADFLEATMSLSNELGIVADLSSKTAKEFGVMTHKLGLSVEQASQLTTLSSAMGDTNGTTTSAITGQVLALNAVNKSAIKYQDVLKDVSEMSAAQQLSISQQEGGLAKAAYQARKLGLSFSQLNSSADALLDFESSISAELEAELLTGKQLNLEKARMAALTGDDATLAAELAKNIGTAAEFSKMNRLERQAMAKAMGMTTDEMAETLLKQEAINKLSSIEGDTLDDKVANEMARIDAITDVKKREEERAKLFNKLGDSEYKRQLENKTLQEATNEAMRQMAEAAQSLAILLEPLTGFMSGLANAGAGALGFFIKIGSKLKTIGAIIADNVLKPMDKFAKIPKMLIKHFGKFGKFLAGGFLKMAGKSGIKSLLKKIPVLGLIVGAGMAYKRFKEGDILGGVMEIGSGVASLFPGVGTAISAGIDASLLATDMTGVTGQNKKAKAEEEDTAADFISRPGQPIQKFRKDDVIIGATKPFGGGENNDNVEKLLNRLVTAVERGGVINIDGNKVGDALVMGNYKTS